ncbi:hypothetical protein H6G91_32055 [Nostoc muscorum FACHB-395]|nr:hypothetical protein [Desmonostoc muscorum FACHB-395]
MSLILGEIKKVKLPPHKGFRARLSVAQKWIKSSKGDPRNKMPSRINNIFGTTEISRRFRLEGESGGWAFYYW